MTELSTETIRALSADETESVAGAWSVPYYAAVHQFVHPLDLVSLNPQPLPPGPPPDIFAFRMR